MNKTIRILVHGMTGKLGGMESVIMNYYRNINPERICFDFLCVNQKPAYYQEIINRGSKVYVIPGRKKYITHYRKLVSVFKKNKYDGFWSNRCDLSGTPLFFKLAREYGVPLRILHAHSSNNMKSFFYRVSHEVDKYRIKNYATDFWACSEKASKYFYTKKIVSSPRYKVIKNAINMDDFKFNIVVRDNTRKKLTLEDKLVIGHVGRFTFEKKHDFLIRIFHEIHRKEPNTVLLLVGDGKIRSEIEMMVNSLNLSDAVHFLGVRSDIPALLNAMDIFVFPSEFEGLGIAVIEAQVASLRSVASTNIPLEAAITDLLTFVDLKQTPEDWANIILEKRNYARVDMTDQIRKAGYDIKTEAANLEQYLIDRYEGKC